MMNTLLLANTGNILIDAPLTLLIIVLTSITSYRVMENEAEKNKLLFIPYGVKYHKEWYRFFTHALVHGSWIHLIFNMYVLYMFGMMVESYFAQRFGVVLGTFIYLGLYASAIPLASVYTYFKQNENRYYRSLGASGAVSAVVFAAILMQPFMPMGLILVSDITGIWFAAFFFGALYLMYSAYSAKKENTRIEHNAHYWGAIWGMLFTTIIAPDIMLDAIDNIATGNFQLFYQIRR